MTRDLVKMILQAIGDEPARVPAIVNRLDGPVRRVMLEMIDQGILRIEPNHKLSVVRHPARRKETTP